MGLINTIKDYKELILYSSPIDVKKRYRRSVLGPFWISLNLLIFAFSIGTLWSHVMNVPLEKYLPYFCLGYLAWEFISSIITQSSLVFVSKRNIILNMNLPLEFYIICFIIDHFIVFFHHLIAFAVIALIFQSVSYTMVIFIIPALIIYFFNAYWVIIVIGVLCLRYRDIGNMIPQIVRIFFFLTPILWMPEMSNKFVNIVQYNPFTYFLDIFRKPLLGEVPSFLSYVITTSFALCGMLLGHYVLRKYKKQIPYWL